jgi:hypothetical protein
VISRRKRRRAAMPTPLVMPGRRTRAGSKF